MLLTHAEAVDARKYLYGKYTAIIGKPAPPETCTSRLLRGDVCLVDAQDRATLAGLDSAISIQGVTLVSELTPAEEASLQNQATATDKLSLFNSLKTLLNLPENTSSFVVNCSSVDSEERISVTVTYHPA